MLLRRGVPSSSRPPRSIRESVIPPGKDIGVGLFAVMKGDFAGPKVHRASPEATPAALEQLVIRCRMVRITFRCIPQQLRRSCSIQSIHNKVIPRNMLLSAIEESLFAPDE